MKTIRLALAQVNPKVGDLAGNARLIVDFARKAAEAGADLVLYPEMTLTGYPPEDLVLVPAFRQAAWDAARQIAKDTEALKCDLIFGNLWEEDGQIYNASVMASGGRLARLRSKHALPNYGVFDEKRTFSVGDAPRVVEWRGLKLGLLICEEVWDVAHAQSLGAQGAQILLVQNASPYHIGKGRQRKQVVDAAVKATGLPLVYLNLVGGQDELVFDGRSYAVDAQGGDVARLPGFVEALGMTEWECPCGTADARSSSPRGRRLGGGGEPHATSAAPPPQPSPAGGEGADPPEGVWRCVGGPMIETRSNEETIYNALVLGLRDYVRKNNFPGVVLGLSGGIDSALSAAIAVDALGPERVLGLRLPSPYSSVDSLEDAEILAKHLGVATHTIPISDAMGAAGNALAPLFAGRAADTTEENIQARLRGLLTMAVSNKFGHMVLTTGNKSEMSVGYATLYGDMCGGFSVLKDVYKTTVYKLSRWRNVGDLAGLGFLGPQGAVIPERSITKPPSAELRPDQKDQDSLPEYDVLDTILRGLVERQLSVKELVAEGLDAPTVEKVAKLLWSAEYKRRQSAPGVKITQMAFGRDRRWPITNAWKFE